MWSVKRIRSPSPRDDGFSGHGITGTFSPAHGNGQSHYLLPTAVAAESPEPAGLLWFGRCTDPKGAGNR